VALQADVPPVPEEEAAQLAHLMEVRRQLEAQAVAAQRKVLAQAHHDSLSRPAHGGRLAVDRHVDTLQRRWGCSQRSAEEWELGAWA